MLPSLYNGPPQNNGSPNGDDWEQLKRRLKDAMTYSHLGLKWGSGVILLIAAIVVSSFLLWFVTRLSCWGIDRLDPILR